MIGMSFLLLLCALFFSLQTTVATETCPLPGQWLYRFETASMLSPLDFTRGTPFTVLKPGFDVPSTFFHNQTRVELTLMRYDLHWDQAVPHWLQWVHDLLRGFMDAPVLIKLWKHTDRSSGRLLNRLSERKIRAFTKPSLSVHDLSVRYSAKPFHRVYHVPTKGAWRVLGMPAYGVACQPQLKEGRRESRWSIYQLAFDINLAEWSEMEKILIQIEEKRWLRVWPMRRLQAFMFESDPFVVREVVTESEPQETVEETPSEIMSDDFHSIDVEQADSSEDSDSSSMGGDEDRIQMQSYSAAQKLYVVDEQALGNRKEKELSANPSSLMSGYATSLEDDFPLSLTRTSSKGSKLRHSFEEGHEGPGTPRESLHQSSSSLISLLEGKSQEHREVEESSVVSDGEEEKECATESTPLVVSPVEFSMVETPTMSVVSPPVPFEEPAELQLAEAALKGDTFEVRRLIASHSLDIHWDHDRILVSAVRSGNPLVLEAILALKPQLNVRDGLPLLLAVDSGHLGLFQQLVKAGANPRFDHHAPFLRAAESGRVSICRWLLETSRVRADAEQSLGLVMAARSGHVSTVQLLMDFGANPHVHHELPLRDAAMNGHLKMVEFLVRKARANVDAQQSEALNEAVRHRHFDVVSFLHPLSRRKFWFAQFVGDEPLAHDVLKHVYPTPAFDGDVLQKCAETCEDRSLWRKVLGHHHTNELLSQRSLVQRLVTALAMRDRVDLLQLLSKKVNISKMCLEDQPKLLRRSKPLISWESMDGCHVAQLQLLQKEKAYQYLVNLFEREKAATM